jgi:hypothetical protein
MSALPPKADIRGAHWDVPRKSRTVCKSGSRNLLGKWPFLANYFHFLLHPISLLLNIFSLFRTPGRFFFLVRHFSFASCCSTANVYLRIKSSENVMCDIFGEAKRRLAREIDFHSALACKPIPADPWVISSLLQKSIRRGEIEIARRAALTLSKHRGAAIWPRLIVIAFEDIGIGSVGAVTMTVAASDDSAWRRAHGGDVRLAVAVAGILAQAPKDRSADYLGGAKDHPLLAGFAQEMASASPATRLSRIGSRALDLPHRAVAALLASGIATRNGDRHAVLSAFHNLGVPESLVVATSIAAAKTREAITAMVPLIWLAARESKRQVCNYPVPPRVDAVEMPLYALDMHTRLGREAIWRFTRENTEVRSCLARCVPEPCWRRAAYVTAFYVDGGPIARRLLWDQSEALEAFGIERDLLHAGVPAEGIQPLLAAMRANLEHLNELRAQVLANFQATQAGRSPSRRRDW